MAIPPIQPWLLNCEGQKTKKVSFLPSYWFKPLHTETRGGSVTPQCFSPGRQVDAVEEVGEGLLVWESGERVQGEERYRDPAGEEQTWGRSGVTHRALTLSLP